MNPWIRTLVLAVVVYLAILALVAWGATADEVTARRVCSTCHAYVAPEALPPKAWETILPAMQRMMGPGPELVDVAAWYRAKSQGPTLRASWSIQACSGASYLSLITDGVVVGTVGPARLETYTLDGRRLAWTYMPSPVVDMVDSGPLLLGNWSGLRDADLAKPEPEYGALVDTRARHSRLSEPIGGLRRPARALRVGDGWLVAEFGYNAAHRMPDPSPYRGRLTWKGRTLLERDGVVDVVRVHPTRKELVVAVAQESETLDWLSLETEPPTWRRIAQRPPHAGSIRLVALDWDGDGRLDVGLVTGDAGDFNRAEPALVAAKAALHGLTIYLQRVHGQFTSDLFVPLYNAVGAVALEGRGVALIGGAQKGAMPALWIVTPPGNVQPVPVSGLRPSVVAAKAGLVAIAGPTQTWWWPWSTTCTVQVWARP